MKLVGVIPAKDEEDTIGDVLEELQAVCDDAGHDLEVVVVSGSHDATDRISGEHDATVIPDGGTGLGEAMRRGLKEALAHDPDYIFSIDADHQFQPDELPRLVAAAGESDLVLGSRFLEDGVEYPMSLSHRIGNRLLTWMVNHATGLSLTDAQTGFRLMVPGVAEELRMVGRHTYVQETIIDAYRNGFSVTEVPVSFEERTSGGSRVVSSITTYALRTFPVILHRAGYTPHIMNGVALFLAALSAVSLGYGVWKPDYEGLLFAAVLAAVTVQTFFLSMYLDSTLP